MALGDYMAPPTSQTALDPAADLASEVSEDFTAFFYLRDLLSAADLSTMALKLVQSHLTLTDLPPEIETVLNLVPDTAQFLALVPDFLEKLDNVRVVCEGALQAAAAQELSNHAAELLTQIDGADDA